MQPDDKAHRQKRENAVDAEFAARKRRKERKATHALQQQAAQIESERELADPEGITYIGETLKVLAEEEAEALADRQDRQRELAQQRQDERERRAAHAWRRQDEAQRRRESVRRMLRNQLGRDPTNQEFMVAVAHLRIDPNWSDDDA